MGVLDHTNANNNTRRNSGNSDKPAAKLWLNIGYMANGRFVNLPVGIPIDTMEPVKVTGQNEDWVQFQNAKNELLKAVQAMGDQLAPGAEIGVPNLTINLRRVNEAVEVVQSENPYSVDLSSLLTGTNG